MWVVMRWVAPTLAALALLSTTGTASAQTVGLNMEGPASGAVARSLASRLSRGGIELRDVDGTDAAAAAQSGGLDGVILGRTRRRGGRWRAEATLYDPAGNAVSTVRASGRSSGALARGLARQLGPQVSNLQSAPPPSLDGETRRVMVGDFSGPGSSRVRSRVVDVLGDASGVELVEGDGSPAELGVAAVVTGETLRRGRSWRGRLYVHDASGNEVGTTDIRGRNANGLAGAVSRQARDPLVGLIAQTSAAAPVVAIEEPFEPIGADDPDEDEDEDDDEDELDDPNEPSELPTALDVAVYGRAVNRKLRYNDDLYGLLRGYTLPLGPAIFAQVRWFPAAHFTDSFIAHVGLDITYERAFGIDSKRNDGEVFPTTMQSWSFALRGRIPLGAHQAALNVGYGGHDFVVEPSGPAVPGRSNTPEVPQVKYRFVRIGADARLAPVAGLRLMVGASYLVVLDFGGISDDLWFPRSDVGGIELQAGIGYELDVGIEIRAMFDLRRYFYTMNPEVGDPWIAGGALDQYLSGSLGLAWRI